MFLGVLLAVSLAPIQFEAKGMSVKNALARLSTATGGNFQANGAVGDEVVFVKVNEVTLDELKRKLADVLDATWIIKPEAEYLARTPAQDAAIWQRHLELRSRLLQDSLESVKKQIAQPFSGPTLAKGLADLKPQDPAAGRAGATQRYQRERALFQSAPMARLLNRLLLACDPKDLAAVGPYERRIFCLHPTRMQRGINAKAFQAALDAFNREQADWVEAASKVTFTEDPNGRMVSDPRSQTEFTGKDMEGVELEVRRGEMTALFNVNMIAPNSGPRGRSIVCQADLEDPARRFMNKQMEAGPAPTSDPVVTLSEDSTEFQKRLSSVFRSGTAGALSERMLRMMKEVDKADPLSWTPGDAISAYADLKKVNVVGALPDDALTLGTFVAGDGPLRTQQFMTTLTEFGTIVPAEANGWLTFAPTDAWESHLLTTRRGALATLMKAVDAKHALDIRDYAKFAFDSRLPSRMTFGLLFLGMYDRTILGASDQTDWNALRLYGSFTPDAQMDLEGGKQFLFGGLNAEQRKIAEAIVYRGMIESNEAIDGRSASLKHEPVEPTEAFPGGLPPNGFVTARSRSLPVIVAYGKGTDGKVRPLRTADPYTLATIETEIVGNPTMMEQYGVAGLVGYAPGKDKLVSLRVQVGDGLWKESNITIPDYNLNATPVSWDKLPEPFKTQVAAAMEQLKQRKQQGGGTIPPLW